MPLPIVGEPPAFATPEGMRMYMTANGCRRCELGFQPEINGCCVSRGNSQKRRMIIGEAPGKDEDTTRLPFTGPAGQLMDRIFSSVGLDTNKDFYCTNVVKCRPFLPKGFGKENFTPKEEQQKRCRVYLDQEIELVQPRLIVLVGKIAIAQLLPDCAKVSMEMLHGTDYTPVKGGPTYFMMYHPAAILHATPFPDQQLKLRQDTWNDIQRLKSIIEERGL
jgi:uracil-DNA glycosylase